MTTVLTNAEGYNTKRMEFSKPEVGTIQNGDAPAIKYRRIKILTRNPDNSVGDLIVPTSEVFSYGIQENISPETNKVNGYIMALCLWKKDGPTKEENTFTDTFNNIIECCKDYLLKNKDVLELYELDSSELKKFNPLYWKKEKGKIVDGKGPTLYAKLITSKKNILTYFTNSETGEDIVPLDLLKKYCFVEGAIKFESIYIGNKISLQIKLHEGIVRLLNTGISRLLTRPKPSEKVTVNLETAQNALEGSGEDVESSSESEKGSLHESSESEEEAAAPPPKIVRRKVVKKK